MMGGPMMDGWWWLWGLLWLLVGLAVLALLVTLIVWLVRTMTSGDRGRSSAAPAGGGSPREVLDARYARGELDRDQYLQARRDIGDPAD